MDNHLPHDILEILPVPGVTVMAGAPKTAAGLGLPETVAIRTIREEVLPANVVWDVAAAAYDPLLEMEQTFTVTGHITLPGGISNGDGLLLEVTVTVTAVALVQFIIANPFQNVNWQTFGRYRLRCIPTPKIRTERNLPKPWYENITTATSASLPVPTTTTLR